MEAQAQTLTVRIYNQTYSIRSNDGNIERTQELAAKVDKQMHEIAKGALTADSLKVAILAALHIADELDRANSKYDDLDREVAERSSECAELLDTILKGK